jgi:hypothetical protein
VAGELLETQSEVEVIATIGTILVWALIVFAGAAGAAGLLFAFIGFMFLSVGRRDADL